MPNILNKHIDKYSIAVAKKGELEEIFENLDDEIEYEKQIILELMDGLGLKQIEDDFGIKFKRKTDAFISVKIADREKLAQFAGSEADTIIKKRDPEIVKKSLNSWGSKRLKKDEELPSWIGVYYEDDLKISKPRKKG